MSAGKHQDRDRWLYFCQRGGEAIESVCVLAMLLYTLLPRDPCNQLLFSVG